MQRKAVFFIGPTGVGKTDIGVRIAKHFNGEIISADSRQMYRFMDIGTDKPPSEYLRQIPHHFINILEPDEYYNAGQFGKDVRKKADDIISRNKLPIIVGGSGLYIQSILYGFFDEIEKDIEVKHAFQNRIKTEGTEKLYNELFLVDQEYAAKISKNDAQRIVRGLEVFNVTEKPLSQHWKDSKSQEYFDALLFGLHMKRQHLYNRINVRVDTMLDKGLINETKQLLDKDYSPELNALKTYGYHEAILYLKGEITKTEVRETIQRRTRNFAKRQITWFKKMENVQWIDVNEGNEQVLQGIIDEISQHIQTSVGKSN